MELLVATRSGFVSASKKGERWRVTGRGLDGRSLTCIARQNDVILAGAEDGLFRSADGGEQWEEVDAGLTQAHLRWLSFHPEQAGLAFAGTEPAALFRSTDGGRTWRERPEVAELRQAFDWFLPYSPEAGAVRGFAWHGARGYAAVEVGGALRSDDFGETWSLVPGSSGRPRTGSPPGDQIQADVHSIAVHPSSPDLALAPTGGGFFRSRDGGATWTRLHADYCRAVWAAPQNREQMILGPASGPSGRDGRIVHTDDGGAAWTTVATFNRNMPERFLGVGETLFAVLANGELFAAHRERLAWRQILPQQEGITAVIAAA